MAVRALRTTTRDLAVMLEPPDPGIEEGTYKQTIYKD